MLGGKNALLNDPIEAIQQFYIGESQEGANFDARKLAQLVREKANVFPKFIEQ